LRGLPKKPKLGEGANSRREEYVTESTTSYPGPLSLAEAKTKFKLSSPLADESFHREGPRANVEYRDLGLSEATGGKIGAKHIRAIRPFDKETGWHWHDMTGHFVYVLKGWLKFRFEGVADDVVVHAGSCLSQPAGVPHNVVGQSDDLEVLEINLPANYATVDLAR
jgi:mannose-6-phosphate isomerase-like protein (cupin superfamily)